MHTFCFIVFSPATGAEKQCIKEDVVTPQYHETWLSDYTIQRSAGTLDTFIGFSPYQRASGSDGFTIASQGSPLYFEVDYQRVEVSR